MRGDYLGRRVRRARGARSVRNDPKPRAKFMRGCRDALVNAPFVLNFASSRHTTMSVPSMDPPSYEELQYIIDHVFLPPKLPQAEDHRPSHDILLSRLAHEAAVDFGGLLSQEQQEAWSIVVGMLRRLAKITQTTDTPTLVNDIIGLSNGGAFFHSCRVRNIA